MSVTDITEVLGKRRARAQFARLSGLADRHLQDVLRDPMPHLIRMERLVAKMRRAIDEADHYLTGDGELLLSRSPDPPEPPRPYASLLIDRIARARDVLGKAMEEK